MNESNLKLAILLQGILQILATILSFILFAVGIVLFTYGFYTFVKEIFNPVVIKEENLINFINTIFNSFELFFMAPIPFLVIFGHRNNIIEAFKKIIKTNYSGKIELIDEIKAKKTFVSSIIGILITSILKFFIDILHSYNGFEISWQFFAIIVSIFLFLIILIFYYKLLSNHENKEKEIHD